MGNAGSQETKEPVSDYRSSLSVEEERELEKVYNLVSASKQSGDIDASIAIFGSHSAVNVFSTSLSFQTISGFKKFVINATRINSTKTVEVFFQLFASGHDPLDKFFRFIVLISLGIDADELSTQKLVAAVQMGSSDVSGEFNILMAYIHAFAPCLPSLLQTYVNTHFLGSIEKPYSRDFQSPQATDSEIVNKADILALGLFSDSLQGTWKKLYTSTSDGRSFNRIVHHILGYEGPTCIIIKSTGIGGTANIFGVYCEERWRDSNRFHGSSKNFLFTLSPYLRIMRSKSSSNGAYQWLNCRTFGYPHGLGFGGSLERFRLFIPESLEDCTAYNSCLTYEPGPLLAPKSGDDQLSGIEAAGSVFHSLGRDSYLFDIDCIEVFGCGGDAIVQKGLQALSKNRQIMAEDIDRARKVDKAQFFNNEFDQEFLLGKTMAHKSQIADR